MSQIMVQCDTGACQLQTTVQHVAIQWYWATKSSGHNKAATSVSAIMLDWFMELEPLQVRYMLHSHQQDECDELVMTPCSISVEVN